MVVYNFKKIQPVPNGKDFIDIVLTRTTRKTPTIVHKQYPIQRIRSFYMRKVKFTQSTIHEKLTQILDDFPRLDDIHPFYADLMNVMYDKDHYKLALGQLASARRMVDQIGQEYLRVLKFGDSLYRCKQLKRAALGRMMTLVKKQNPAFTYLEEVRNHLARLPSIDPNTRTIILCGYPNVGKSSFMNKVTRADVDVQPYAFTTRSLFVGHTDYKLLRWQVIDTPGVLDHPLEDRNNIEMLSITALAHLRAAVLYIMDLSGDCGYSIDEQVALFRNIKPLFSNKPLIIALNKLDRQTLDGVSAYHRNLINEVVAESNCELLAMSTLTEDGVMNVKNRACEMLLEQRVQSKLAGRKVEEVLNRIHIAEPAQRDEKDRDVTIPPSVLEARARHEARMAALKAQEEAEGGAPSAASSSRSRTRRAYASASSSGMDLDDADRRPTERDLEVANGGPGVYRPDLRKHYDLRDSSHKYDIIPEIMDGRNIADFVDPDILAKLQELEEEEDRLMEEAEADGRIHEPESDEEEIELDSDLEEAATVIRKRRRLAREEHARTISSARPLPRSLRTTEETLGVIETAAERGRISGGTRNTLVERAQSRGRSIDPITSRKRARSASASAAGEDASRSRSRSRSRVDRAPSAVKGVSDRRRQVQALKTVEIAQRKRRGQFNAAGEADRVVNTKMPKHLYSGKRTIGKNDRR
nr:nucleolar GTP-binding protein [Seculamonas ecuadoriensis]